MLTEFQCTNCEKQHCNGHTLAYQIGYSPRLLTCVARTLHSINYFRIFDGFTESQHTSVPFHKT